MSHTLETSSNMTLGPEEFNAHSPIQITCQNNNCCYTWEFTVGEQEWYDQKGFQYPKYCSACKVERRGNKNKNEQKRVQYQNITIKCKDCELNFTWLPRDQAFFAKQNPPFPPPQRCQGCKQQRTPHFLHSHLINTQITILKG